MVNRLNSGGKFATVHMFDLVSHFTISANLQLFDLTFSKTADYTKHTML